MAKKKEHFEGTIVIGDPCSMVSCEEDWQTAKWGERMDALGIGAFLSIEFEEDIREIVDDRGPVLGEFCTDSCVVVVVGLEDLLKYNPPSRVSWHPILRISPSSKTSWAMSLTAKKGTSAKSLAKETSILPVVQRTNSGL